MNQGILFLLLIISNLIQGQSVFTDVFAGQTPAPLLIINDELYVGTLQTSHPVLQKVPLNDPNNPILVATICSQGCGGGPWKMVYDLNNNDIYAYSLNGWFSKVDLDQSLPITPEQLVPTFSSGMAISGSTIYIAVGEDLYTYDIDVGPSSFDLYYSDSGNTILNPAIYNGELYYAWGVQPSLNLYKIDLSQQNPVRTEVAVNITGAVQSSLMVQKYLYLGLESESKILRFDLDDSSYPLTSVTVLPNPDGGVIGLANHGNSIYASEGNSNHIISFVDSDLGMTDVNNSAISMFPNPVEDKLFLNYQGQEDDVEFHIYNVGGQILQSGEIMDHIYVSQLADGLYFIEFVSDVGKQTKKFIKK